MKVETKKELIEELTKIKPILNNDFGVLKIGVFGSFAKDTVNSNSDVDLLVEMKSPDFDSFVGLKIFLENLFERNVDLVRKRNQIKTSFLNRIQKDIINV
ncbi:nucleotidyltransferase domain-containing protein [Leptospira sp. 2 VSF19]|uniref:Nucleotidyltransferase domain-containing protein n=4 Tax=Leptospira soteropolitanensis TaxID=2950025 RepID=A0ABT3MNV7_9LEPT|nr:MULTISPECIES: nucleotidyltransferase domain-containing protein [Leptospira]MCW7494876.1 nucleotidyltransferase domain-containing protein [Leptospira soteropolitanensis]MCW7502358.1 nucleotidyltransferase domain-containing protein [Leptospira soteropolitanensis]MCW7524695.1 nucleotidyltransferase domain-containing protein [Leptospira soteropolitanensis]MCW7528566.1 nucleotidyltransferase domain-containing protein [Leptospira soteropolitanensis]TGL97999.1 toxin-antitoxin system toxin subunit 